MKPTLSMWRGVGIRPPVPVMSPERAKTPPERVRKIQAETAEKHGLRADDLCGRARNKTVSLARFEAIARVRSEIFIAGAPASLPLIGAWFGGRDHSTVLNAISRYAELTAEAA